MKRDKFRITYDGKELVKHTWNSAVRATEDLIREVARVEGVFYELVGSQSVKEGSGYVKGFRAWGNVSAGKLVVFEIQKVE